MEFPHLGRHCSLDSCNKLDFLPVKCDACRHVYCADHYSYANHNCIASNGRDVQVPSCPLCGLPVPGGRGEAPDVAVSAHIDNDCKSDNAAAKRAKIFKNRCQMKGCKIKELMPIVCNGCRINFCLRHRHPADHACGGPLQAKRRLAAEAAAARMNSFFSSGAPVSHTSRTEANVLTAIHGNMTEDEALAHALALSLEGEESSEARDATLARALQRQRVGGDTSQRCNIS